MILAAEIAEETQMSANDIVASTKKEAETQTEHDLMRLLFATDRIADVYAHFEHSPTKMLQFHTNSIGTLMHYAAAYGTFDAFVKMAELNGGDVNNQKNEAADTPLHVVCKRNMVQAVDWLLAKPLVNYSLRNAQNKFALQYNNLQARYTRKLRRFARLFLLPNDV